MYNNLNRINLILIIVTLFATNAWAVFGGVKTDTVMQDSLVSLVMAKGTCSGVLVSDNVVLSAAHCKDMLGAPIRAILISDDPEKKHCNRSEITEFAYTANAKPIFPRNVHAPDLVIFKLESELCSGKPATITSEPLVPGDALDLTGYGGGSGLWFKTRQIKMEVIENEGAEDLSTSDNSLFKRLLDLSSDYYLYALPVEENETACNGDSGGPLFVNNNNQMELRAISGAVFPNKELGSDKCNNGYLHLITPIAPYFDWIQEKINLWELK